jgi:hypothetical protein
MPEVAGEAPISSVLGQPRPRVSQHTFLGGNSFMLGILNRYRGELGVTALPQELDAAISAPESYLGSQTAAVTIASAAVTGSRLDLDVAVTNLAGHKLPTAYPSRRVWLHVSVSDTDGNVVFESGAPRADGAIDGNDNDMDAVRFEPHYDEIRSADQVQIYESIMADRADAVTTGLLRGVRYIKDNRLLPRGFDKTTAPADVAVHGEAAADASFAAGGDRLRYRVELGNAGGRELHVAVELLYQTIGYRWAENLKDYPAVETDRFVEYYRDSIEGAAERLASDRMEIE